MTLIAGFKFKNCPILLGDLLISGSVSEDKKLPICKEILPLNDEMENIWGDDCNYGITALKQKLFILSDTVAIAWCGCLIEAAMIIEELKKHLKEFKELSNQDIKKIMNKNKSYLKESSYIWFSVENNEVISGCFNEINTYESPNFDEFYAGGTGCQVFKNGDEAFGVLNKNIPDDEIVVSVISRTLSMILGLLNHELALQNNAETLRDGFGGCYEIIAFYDGKFQRINGISYIFFEGYLDDENINISTPRTVLKSEYDDDSNLIITRVDLEDADKSKIFDFTGLLRVENYKEILVKEFKNSKNISEKEDSPDYISCKILVSPFICLVFNHAWLGRPHFSSLIIKKENTQDMLDELKLCVINKRAVYYNSSEIFREKIENFVRKSIDLELQNESSH
jgi:hypothetical protein